MKLNFKKLGEGEPIIILHGFLGTLDNWISIGRSLSKNFSVYLVDQRNHGLSPRSDSFSYKEMAKDIHDLIQDENLENPVLMGHSMGGKTVMEFSRLYNDAFSKLIIVDIAPRKYPVHHQHIFDGLLSIDIDNLKHRSDADDQLAKYVEEAGIRQFLLKNLTRTKTGFEWKANLSILENSQEMVVQKIFEENVSEKPVFFIAGSKSDYIKREDRSSIKAMYSNAQILTIKDAGHWVHAEQPEAFLKTVTYFL